MKSDLYEDFEQGEGSDEQIHNPRKKAIQRNSFFKNPYIISLSLVVIFVIFSFFFFSANAQKNLSAMGQPTITPLSDDEFLKRISMNRDNSPKGKRLESIDKIMRPKSIAVIGYSTKVGTIGFDFLDILKRYKYQGKIYPINPKGGEVQGLKIYKSVMEVPDEIDLGVVLVNAKFVLSTIDECGEKGIKGVLIVSAGFKEIGGKGTQLEEELKARLAKYKIRAIGPNILGAINTNINMDASFDQAYPYPGDFGFVSQSGALGTLIFSFLRTFTIGLSQFVGIGNQADVSVEDIIEYWEDDQTVKQIMLYSEGIASPAKFRQIASKTSKKKPILALKAGRTTQGAKAATKHTGSIAGDPRAAAALIKQTGAIQETSFRTMLNVIKTFKYGPLPKGNKIGIITLGGGVGIISTDTFIEHGFQMAQFEEKTKKELRSFLLPIASVDNPVDMVASANIESFERSIEALSNDKNVDIIITLNVRLKLDPLDIAKAVIRKKEQHPGKCIVSVFVFEDDFFIDLAQLPNINLPFYSWPEDAAKALKDVLDYQEWQKRPEGKIEHFTVDKSKAEKILNNKKNLSKEDIYDLFKIYGVKTSKTKAFKESEVKKMLSINVEYAETFGHMVSLSLGGVMYGLVKENNHRLTPLTDLDIQDIINEMQMKEILNDVNGSVKVDIKDLKEFISRISQMIEDFKGIKKLNIKNINVDNDDGKVYADQIEISF